MKKLLIGAAAATFVIAAPAQAHKMHHGHHGHHGHHADHTMGGGHTASVKIDGADVPVCSGSVVDHCVNPREAGLNFGNRPTQVYRPH